MKSKLGDKARLQHIMDCIEEINLATNGLVQSEFEQNHILRIAVVKWLEIIGEAANHLSSELKVTNKEIEWRHVIGLRNIVVHEYFGINFSTIWNIVQNQIPQLRTTIEKLINRL